jgi:hypothetical protein
MTFKKYLGAVILASPFIALFVFTYIMGGLDAIIFVWGGTGVIVGVICLGVSLMTGDF